MNAPKLPVPSPLRGKDTAFTRKTMGQRLPGIVQRILTENELSETAVTQITALLHEIPEGKIRPLPDHLAPDLDNWQTAITPHLGQIYLEAPWFFNETYIYRRIAAAVDYFRSGIDPFAQQKRQSLTATLEQTDALITQLNQMIAEGWQAVHFRQLLLADLWGNQADMSMWAAGDAAMPNHAKSADQLAHLLVDDETAVTHFLQNPVNQIDFIIDNAGFELMGIYVWPIIYYRLIKQPQFGSISNCTPPSSPTLPFWMWKPPSLIYASRPGQPCQTQGND